jgi:hypothetical protein
MVGAGTSPLDSAMKPTPQQTVLAAIERLICDEIDAYNDSVATGNDELAQMIHLSIQSLKRRRESALKHL